MRASAAGVRLAAVLFVCTALCAIWAAFMPIFALPDEMAHYDYAAYLESAGGAFYLAHGTAADAADPKTRRLQGIVGYRGMRYDPYATVPANYAARLRSGGCDANDARSISGAAVPYVMFFYPPAYYFVSVGAMRLADLLPCASTIREFFAARAVGIALLAFTLVFWYRLLRLAGASRMPAALLVLGAGSLPVVSTLFASVQPDTLSTAGVAAAIVFAAYWRASPEKLWAAVFAIVSLALLVCVKEQYALAAWTGTAAIAIEVASRRAASVRARCLAGIALLSLAAIFFAASHSLLVASSAITALSHSNATRIGATGAFAGALDGLRDIYYDGSAFRSFWSAFGVRGSEALAPAVRSMLSCVSLVSAIALIVVFARGTIVALRAPECAKLRLALGHLTSYHFAVSYFALTAIVLAVYVTQTGGFQMEGRYWVPVLGAFLALLVRLAIDTRGPVAGNRLLATGAIGFCAFALATQCSALLRMTEDYYGPARTPVHETVAAIDAVGTTALSGIDGEARVAARPNVPLRVSGFAVDMETGLPARHVVLDVGGRRVEAAVGLPTPFVQRIFNDRAIADSGFSATIELREADGRSQRMRGYVVDRAGAAIPFTKSIDFTL